MTNMKEKLEDIWDDIKSWYDRNIDTPYYNVKNGVANLWRWFPTVWKIRNWDYHYIYMVLHKQLFSYGEGLS